MSALHRDLALVLLVLGVLGFALWLRDAVSPEPAPRAEPAERAAGVESSPGAALTVAGLPPRASERRARTGPRTPPETEAGKSPEERDAPEGAGGAAEEVEPERTQAAEEEEREDRRELLEAIENPSAAELVELGELAFDSGDSHAAYRYYLEVIEDSPDDPMAPFALYKLAWAEFNLGDTQAAIDDMSLVGEWLASGDAQLAEILAAAVPEDLGRFETRAESEAAGGSEL